MNRKQKDAFQDFQALTRDAWDDGDDNLMSSFKMSIDDVHSSAQKIIKQHSENFPVENGRRKSDDEFYATGSPTPQPRSLKGQLGSGSFKNTSSQMSGGPGVGVRMQTVPKNLSKSASSNDSSAERETARNEKFRLLLKQQSLILTDLKELSWSGIPSTYRPATWKILSGYIPPSFDRRELTLKRKRQEYFNFVDQYYESRLSDLHQETFRQIHIDIPRMSPLIPLFQQNKVQEMFERVLFIWAIRHPASGYVQGINDLLTPFFVVFLSEYVDKDCDLDNCDVGALSSATREVIEADCFWCFSKLLDGIQDNYTFAQPGIQSKVNALKELVSRIDNQLHKHLEEQHVEYLQFSFRWMNNLLMREMPLRCIIRLWDTCLCESDGFASFHLYVCASFLTKFTSDLQREKDFQGLMIMLQNLPTHNWTDEEIGLLLAEAYKLKFMFADAPMHLMQKK